MTTSYDISEHRHRFASWAAARAAQRGFTTVDNLVRALDDCGVRKGISAQNGRPIDDRAFEKLHRKWCRVIISFLEDGGVRGVTYGRAAKLLAVYLKSAVVLGTDESPLRDQAHPPIDRILLTNLAKSDVESPFKRDWARISWTSLSEAEYYSLIGQLREALPPGRPFWELERYWTITASGASS